MVRPTIAAWALVGALAFSLTLGLSPASGASDEPVVFVVDTSGSMEGASLAEVKDALTSAVGNLDQAQAVGLRTFAGQCDATGTTSVVGPESGTPDEVAAAVNGLTAGGGTPTSVGLSAAIDDVAGLGGGRVVLLSDGASGCTEPTACEVAESAAERDVVVDTVGLGSGADELELVCIAKATGGTYRDVDDEEALTQALSGESGGPDLSTGLMVAAAGLAAVGGWYLGQPSRGWRQRRMVRGHVSVVPAAATPAIAGGSDGDGGTVSVRLRPSDARWELSSDNVQGHA